MRIGVVKLEAVESAVAVVRVLHVVRRLIVILISPPVVEELHRVHFARALDLARDGGTHTLETDVRLADALAVVVAPVQHGGRVVSVADGDGAHDDGRRLSVVRLEPGLVDRRG